MKLPVTYTKSALSIFLTAMMLAPLPVFAATAKKSSTGGSYLPPMAGEMAPVEAPITAHPAPAQSYSSNNNYDQSADAAPSQDDRVKGLLRQALEKHNQGDMNGAERLFKQVLSIDPRNADANFNLGAMYEDRGDLNGAQHYYQVASSLSPQDNDIRDALRSVQDKIKQQATAQQTAQQMQRKTQEKQIADDAAAAYKAGKYDQAINDLNRIAQNEPNDPNVQYGLAQAWRGKGDFNRARQYLNHAIAIQPDNQLYRTTLADMDHDAQRHQQHQSNQPQVADNNDGGPRPAPDYRNRGRGGYGNQGSYGNQSGYDNGNQGLQSYGDDQIASNNSSANDPNGGVQPFTSQGEPTLYGHAVGQNYMRGGGIGMGGVTGGLFGGMMGMGGGRSYYGGSGSRLSRAATGALAGAAIGGLTNMHGYGGFRAGAMRGAVTGGLFSLLTGF